MMDSGGFTELSTHGRWRTSPQQYADEINRWKDNGNLVAAVTQDLMCEPFILHKTGLTIEDHQKITVALTNVYVMPVLQGYSPESYAAHTSPEDVLRRALEAQDAEESWTDDERRALSNHIEKGYFQAEHGELVDGTQARRDGFRFWLRHTGAGSPMHLGRIEFNIVLFMDWSFASGCSPPRLSTTQLPSATDRPVLLSDRDFHPTIGAYFQAHPSSPCRAKNADA
jgi:hypothetical protein